MKKIGLLVILFFACVACDNNESTAAKENEITIEKLSVQEIDDGQIFKDLKIEKNVELQKKLDIVNDNFKTVPKLNPCENIGTINTGEFAIVNDITIKKAQKTKYSFKIYQHKNNICELKNEIKDSQVISATSLNDKLYLEVDNFSTSKKNNLVVYDNGRLSILKADIGHVNNLVAIDNYLFISVGKQIYVLGENNRLITIKNPFKDREFFTIFSNGNNLVIMYKMEKDFDLVGVEYSLKNDLQDATVNNLDNFDIIKTTLIKANDNHFIAYLNPRVNQESDKYLIIDNKLICATDLNSCYRVSISGEEIISLQGDKILLSSDIIYLADFSKKMKTEVAKDNIDGFIIINNNIYFKITKNNKDTYIKYELGS